VNQVISTHGWMLLSLGDDRAQAVGRLRRPVRRSPGPVGAGPGRTAGRGVGWLGRGRVVRSGGAAWPGVVVEVAWVAGRRRLGSLTQLRAVQQPEVVAACPLGDLPGALDHVARDDVIALPAPPCLNGYAACVGRLLQVAPAHALPDQREPGAKRRVVRDPSC